MKASAAVFCAALALLEMAALPLYTSASEPPPL
jgi:hypothetical protein